MFVMTISKELLWPLDKIFLSLKLAAFLTVLFVSARVLFDDDSSVVRDWRVFTGYFGLMFVCFFLTVNVALWAQRKYGKS